MWIVTVGAVAIGWVVNELGLRHAPGELLVTLRAELGAASTQERVVVGDVGVVAHGARALCRGAVLVLLCDDVLVVAAEAEGPEVFSLDIDQQRPARTTVWIMAVGTGVLRGLVRNPPPAHPLGQALVATQASLCLLVRLEGVEIPLGNVAPLTLTDLRDLSPVEVRQIADLLVATLAHTALRGIDLFRWRDCEGRSWQRGQEEEPDAEGRAEAQAPPALVVADCVTADHTIIRGGVRLLSCFVQSYPVLEGHMALGDFAGSHVE
jgi:hypothetical protein